MTKTQETRTRRALKLVEKCNGDCKHCKHTRVPAKASFYAFLCGLADEAGYTPYSNTLAELKRATLDCLNFELGIDKEERL